MTRDEESELFQYLVRNQRFVEWVGTQLDEQIKVLMVNPHMEQLHKAQGACAVYKSMQEKLTAAKAALSR